MPAYNPREGELTVLIASYERSVLIYPLNFIPNET